MAAKGIDIKKITKEVAVMVCKNLFLPVDLSMAKYAAALINNQKTNKITGHNKGTAVVVADK